MKNEQKDQILNTVIQREKLRPLGRLVRLFRDPFRAFPYYILATLSHIKPFRISFRTLWNDTMTGYLPEANTFYYYGFCEANLTSFLVRFLKRNWVFIDVGAHIGFYSMLASRLVGNSGKVYSFEPTPWTYKLLRKNTSNLMNVEALNFGASDCDGEIPFADFGRGYGAYNSGSKEGTMLKFSPRIVAVKTVNLDSFFKLHSISPDFIKLDAEGMEYLILQGMAETLKTARPIITLEMAGEEKWSVNRKISSDILISSNYDVFEMTDGGNIKPCAIAAKYRYNNLLFIPKEKFGLVSNLL